MAFDKAEELYLLLITVSTFHGRMCSVDFLYSEI